MSHFTLLKSKLHRATVTGASLHYEGSLTIAEDLAKKAGFFPYERILVGNINNGERFETYVIYGHAGSRVIELNGATAHLGQVGDRLTIMSFAQVPAELAAKHHPTIVRLDEKNNILS
ncbi:MAG: aspartate 1-decarboxylase [Methylacidiphilales bacterium]|nr:aspartate 1-decarboxylase [Candidatus Methylacidiphilales bacterium]